MSRPDSFRPRFTATGNKRTGWRDLIVLDREYHLFSRQPRIEDFEALALPHLSAVYRTAARLLDDSSCADNVVQEVYVQASKSFGRSPAGADCRVWLFKILFLTLRHYRRKGPQGGMRWSAELLHQGPPSGPPMPREIADHEMLDSLAEIHADYRAAVLLVDVEEFSYQRASFILNVPIRAVMSRLTCGRRLLRERLAGASPSYSLQQPCPEGSTA